MAVQIDTYNKKFKTNYNYIIPYNHMENSTIKHRGSFVGALIEKIIEAKKMIKIMFIIWRWNSKRQFMHAKDLAKIIKLLDNKIAENFNVATKKLFSCEKLISLKHTLKDAKFLIKECQMVK